MLPSYVCLQLTSHPPTAPASWHRALPSPAGPAPCPPCHLAHTPACLQTLRWLPSGLASPSATCSSWHGSNDTSTKRFGIPFRHLPIAARDPASKAAQEAQIEAILQEEGIDVIVLARYMQVGLNGGQNGGLNGEQWWTDVGRAGGHGCGLWAVLAQTAEGVG